MPRLLIVEDDPLLRDTLALRLNREGFQCITASNGVQTIVLARSERPALILLDLDLPILDGWQVVRRLRAFGETRAIPIIVLAESLAPELHQQFLAAGCEAYEPKPMNYPQLIAKIRWLVSPTSGSGLYVREASA